jgi:hypothetical protein
MSTTHATLLGSRIDAVDAAAGTLNATYQAQADLRNPAGTVQSGMLSAMLNDLTASGAGSLIQDTRDEEPLQGLNQTLPRRAASCASKPGAMQSGDVFSSWRQRGSRADRKAYIILGFAQ